MKHEHQEFLQKNAFTITAQLVGLIVIIANLWLATKLAPMAADISGLSMRVEALHSSFIAEKPLFERFVRIEAVVGEINARLERIDQRLSRHIGI